MKLSLLSFVFALALFAAAGWAYRDGADYQLRDLHLSAAERMTVIDASMIGEKWLAVSAGLTGAGGASLSLSAFLHARARRRR